VESKHRKLRPDEYPTLNLPKLRTQVTQPRKRKPPKERVALIETNNTEDPSSGSSRASVGDCSLTTLTSTGVCTDVNSKDTSKEVDLFAECERLKKELKEAQDKLRASEFRVEAFMHNEKKLHYYTGFNSYEKFKACFDFLGPAAYRLTYWDSSTTAEVGDTEKGTKGRNRKLCPIDEFLLVMARLRAGLFETDLAYRFGVSQSTVSRIWITWINFIYLQFQTIPLWPTRAMINADMPECFRKMYPSTRVILDATEIRVEKPGLPMLQQATFSNYKSTNTYKVLVGISPSGVITFVSNLYAGSISDKELTRCSGILGKLEPGDSVMADRGFDIQEDLALLGVGLNIPPFLKGKSQLSESELVETRRIASIRIHVERAMERIKNFHIFDRTLPSSMSTVANQIFYVCAVLSNFQPPLCT